MKLNKGKCWLPVAALLLTGAFAAMADEGKGAAPVPDIAKGKEKSQICVACHGDQGISQQDNYPHLHGQQQTYLLRQMRTFRNGGDRRDPIMTPMLEPMSDQDLVNLAAYFASFRNVLGSDTGMTKAVAATMPSPEVASPAAPAALPVPVEAVATPSPAPAAVSGDAVAGKTKAAACAACHGMDGRGTTPLFPNLNGQHPEYLARQLTAFRDGMRVDPTMAPMAMALTDQDIADLAAFYAAMK